MPCVVEQPPKATYNGIETISAVTYQGWEPGKEYTKNIVLKNVQVKTQKITYSSPSSRFFSTLYPKQIILSAGTSFSLPITFRPLDRNIYEDAINFASKDGHFSIPIKAVLPVFEITVPDNVPLPTCAVKDEVQQTFVVKNNSELATPFNWDVVEPFTIEPSGGVLQPHSSMKLTVTFHPMAAMSFSCEAKCLYGNDPPNVATTTLHAIGKYPVLLVAPSNDPFHRSTSAEVVFTGVPVGTEAKKTVELFNLSTVEVKCTVEQPSSLSNIEVPFTCVVTRVSIPPSTAVQIPIVYQPIMVGSKSTDYIYINTISGTNTLTVKVEGTCIGPDVSLSADSINFSLINVGESATKTFEIYNASPARTVYQFKIDCAESVFKFDQTGGELAPGERRKHIVKFWPIHAINYYRCINCVVENQAPIKLELLGTAHSETVKPAVLEVKHIEQYRRHLERGLSVFPPEQLNEMLASGKLELDANNTLMNKEAESIEPWLDPINPVPATDLYFNDGYHSEIVHSQPHVSLDTIFADFGRCSDMRNIEPTIIRLTNHTQGKIIAQWMGDKSHNFYVEPNNMEVPPNKTADFRVHFNPDQPNNMYGAELECYCSYKSLRDYRLVESLTHTPPFCLTLTAVGSTFHENQATFIPQISLNVPELMFPATNQNEAAYRTITITNKASTPIVYDIPPNDIFSVKPMKGIIKSNKEVLMVKAQPTQVKKYRNYLALGMNQNTDYTLHVPVTCTAETAELLLSNNGEMYFKQTCIGTTCTQAYRIKNISRMPLDFKWSIPSQFAKVLGVEPSTGSILPNEYQDHTFIFSPQELTHYLMTPKIIVTAQGQTKQQSAGKPKVFPVRCQGNGATGELQAEEPYLDFSDVLVGSAATQVFNICNESDCSLKFKLSVNQKLEGQSAEHSSFTDCALFLDCYDGEIPARSKQTIRGIIKPLIRCQHNFEINYQLVTPESKKRYGEPQLLLRAFAKGVFPMMVVKDARIHGSGMGIGKRQLWNLFQLDDLNMFLDSDPSERELMYSVQTRNSTRRRPPVLTRAILDFNFGAAPVNSDPCYVTLHVENSGTVDCEWEFLFPSDLHIDLEGWAENADYTQDELHEMKVMDNKLFNISPKKGKLKPGDTCAVTFTYHHLMAGTDRVPVLLKLSRGREVLINFVGVTVEDHVPYIHFPSNMHSFAPVAIGEKECPKQIYSLLNGGSTPVKFEIDTSPLEMLKSENFDHMILECLTPTGVIAPGQSFSVEWIFYPLEARTYQVDVPIHISGGDTALVTFTGIGYDKKQLGETMPTATESSIIQVPAIQTISVPGQKLELSKERLSFDNIPLFCKTRKVVFMRNTSDHVLSYLWHVTNSKDQRVINIYPSRGTLQPGGSQMAKVVFTALGEPAFYDIDLVCEVVDETSMAQYRRKLRDWENERERQMNEFTITEKDLVNQTINGSKKKNKPVPPNVLLRDTISQDMDKYELYTVPAEDRSFKSYRTIPPIIERSVDKDRSQALDDIKVKAALWKQPTPPKPFLVNPGVIARTHDITTYQEQFFEQMSNYFIDKTLSAKDPTDQKGEEDDSKEMEAISCSTGEADLLAGVISNVLRGLVDDSSFHQAVTKLSNESTPYFNQFKKRGEPEENEGYPMSDLKLYNPQRSLSNVTSSKEVLSQPEMDHSITPAATSYSPEKQTSEVKKNKSSAKQSRSNVTLSEKATKKTQDGGVEETITRSSGFASLVEDVLENTLMNILQEAAHNEINITARQRLIALPPRRSTPPNNKH